MFFEGGKIPPCNATFFAQRNMLSVRTRADSEDEDEVEVEVEKEFDPFSHGTGRDRCRGIHEHHLENVGAPGVTDETSLMPPVAPPAGSPAEVDYSCPLKRQSQDVFARRHRSSGGNTGQT